ncbi:KTSC domain-containing protein [Sphingobacterium sp. 1.A.4]|uniref:KTSC domain-containing protein n=1 Tax=Sphingobacterium sp. 1.A.4 TaxID=2044603 RepID=UPI000C0BDBF9|nr:KTSC domain-containing protein [Sphingobacterium sp. 1.A.4]
MKTAFIWALIFSLIFTIGCTAQNCNNIPNSFESYSEAKKVIENTKFQYTDRIDTHESSWISSASYYSCDGETGFFEMITNKGKNYLFEGMPLEVWKGFKNAKSKGTYYNTHIRDNYQLKINL